MTSEYSNSCLQKTLFVMLVLLIVSHTCEPVPQNRLHRVPSKTRVTGCYIVHISPKEDWAKAESLIKDLEVINDNSSLPNFKAHLVAKIVELVYGFGANLSPDALQYVLDQDFVSFVEEDQFIELGQLPHDGEQQQNGHRVTSWGVDRIDEVDFTLDYHYSPPCNLTGRGVDVYVLDSGIFYSHEHFQGRAIFSGCDIIDNNNMLAQGEENEEERTPQPMMNGADCHGHGTGVAGVIGGSVNGVAPGATLVSVRVIRCDGRTNLVSVLSGLECVLNRTRSYPDRPAVINFSIYGNKNIAMKRAVSVLLKNGITVVALGGNAKHTKSGNSCKGSPGSIQGVITVAASTRYDFAENRTNMGQCIDLLAPATGIVSPLWRRDGGCRDCEAFRYGSSYAAPHVSGAVALLLEKCPRLAPWEVRHHLLKSMTLVNKLNLSPIPKRLRSTTPNLLLHLGPAMCSIEC